MQLEGSLRGGRRGRDAGGGGKRRWRTALPVDSAYGILPDGRAVIEMAAASGLPLVPRAKRNPLETTTWGTGELIRDALEQGLRDITVAIGGSATNDGGMGALAALGVCFYDSAGSLLSGKGADLERVERISLEGLMPEVKDACFTVMCDVRNPLTGPEGAAYTFGKQKGGTPKILDRLEAGMLHWKRRWGGRSGAFREPEPPAVWGPPCFLF